MATQCSQLYALWLPKFHGLMAAVTDAQLSLRSGSEPKLDAIHRQILELIEFYKFLGGQALPEEGALVKDGLRLALQIRALMDSLGKGEGDALFDSYDEFADCAETRAESNDPEILESAQRSLAEYQR